MIKRRDFKILLILFVLTLCSCTKVRTDLEIPEETENNEQEIVLEETNLEPKYQLREVEGEKVSFSETWGYVTQGKEDEYNEEMPVTDVCYFAADVNCYGELINIPVRSKLKVNDESRVHIVFICDSKSLTHFVINPEYGIRKKILNDIVKASEGFDGVQLDFELVPVRDRKNYISFIADLRYKLKGKMLSVCVPARFKLLSEDVYPYEEISNYCDRVFVMAYDEHWSTSKPGAIASVDWCKKVMDYAVKKIPENKLVMGLPFYGRTWSDTPTSGAWYFSGVNRIMTENGVETVEYIDDIPSFTYTTEVNVTGYFNDVYSLVNMCRIYKEANVQKVGFWRIGHEDSKIWDWLVIEK